MSKTFDVTSAQKRASEARARYGSKIVTHYKGGKYRVLDVVVDEATGEPLVIYQSLQYGWKWSRSLRVFEEAMEQDGRAFRRFELRWP